MWCVEVQTTGSSSWRAVYLVVGNDAALASRRVFRRICGELVGARNRPLESNAAYVAARLVHGPRVLAQKSAPRVRYAH